MQSCKIEEPRAMLTPATLPELPEWLRELYPFHTRQYRVGDHTMSVVDEGLSDAPAFVLLHGNPTWSFLFRDLIARLSDKFRVVAPDAIGYGLSDKPQDEGYHTLNRHIANFTGLMEALDLRQPTLALQGWGGPVGLGYAVAHPDKIGRLILCNTWSAPVTLNPRYKKPLAMRIAAAGALGRWLDSLLNLSLPTLISSRTHRVLSDWVFEGYKYPFPNMKSRAAVRAFTRMFSHPNADTLNRLQQIHAGLKNVTAPAEILFGARDPMLNKLPAYMLRDALPNVREPVFLADSSHYLPEDAPDFLAEIAVRDTKSSQESKSDNVFKIIS
jgi:haloalkane dehalogenase